MDGILIEFDDTVVDSKGDYHKLEDFIEAHSGGGEPHDIIADSWDIQTYYNAGDYVRWENGLYVAIVSNIGEYPSNVANWKLTQISKEFISLNEEIANLLKWKLVETKIGTEAISLPANFNEIYISVVIQGSSAHNIITIPYDDLADGLTYFPCGGAYYTSSNYFSAQIRASKTEVRLVEAYFKSTTNVASGSTIKVLYR